MTSSAFRNRYYFRPSKSETRRDCAGSLPIPGTQPDGPVTNNGHLVFFESCLRSVLVCKMKVDYTGEMVHNGKSRPTFDLYSSPSSNPRKTSSPSWPIRFVCYPSAKLLMYEIVQNLARFTWPRVATLRISHTRRKWSEQSTARALKRRETWPDICNRFSVYAKRKYLAITDQPAINVIGLSVVK